MRNFLDLCTERVSLPVYKIPHPNGAIAPPILSPASCSHVFSGGPPISGRSPGISAAECTDSGTPHSCVRCHISRGPGEGGQFFNSMARCALAVSFFPRLLLFISVSGGKRDPDIGRAAVHENSAKIDVAVRRCRCWKFIASAGRARNNTGIVSRKSHSNFAKSSGK